MSDVVGKATLEVGADVSGVRAGLREAEKSVRSFEGAAAKSGKTATASFREIGGAATDSGDRLTASGRRVLEQLDRQVAQIGKTRAEWMEYRAAQAGVANAAAPYIERLKAAEQQTAKVGVSAAQTAAAMRMVPAQFTDIITQLAGGQSALLVLTQQGGQLKDMFGGIVPAVRTLVGYIASLVSPFTVAAAAAAAFGVAAYQGHQEAVQLSKTLQLTGNYAGVTAASFTETAQAIAGSSGSIGDAREALQALVATGRLSGDALRVLGQDAVKMASLTGDSLADVVADYAKMPDGVAKWAAEHNKSMHYMTLAQYDYIKSLEEQGRVQEAVLENAKALHTHLASKGVESVGYLEQAWRGVTRAIGGAWDAMKAFGRESASPGATALNEQRNALLQRAGAARGRGDIEAAKRLEERAQQLEASQQQLALEERRLAELGAKYQREQAAAIDASDKLSKLDEQISKRTALNKALEENRRLEQAIRAVNPNDERISASAIAAREAATRKKFENNSVASGAQNALAGQLEALRGRARAREQVAKDEQTTLEKLRALDFLSQEEFIHRSYEAKRAALQDQVALAEKEAQVAGGRQSMAERQRYLNQVRELQAQVSSTYAQEAADVEKYQEKIRGAIAQTNLQLQNYSATREVQVQRQLNALGMGDEARQLADTLNQVQDQYRRFQDQFTQNVRRTGGANALSSDEYRTELAAIQSALQQQMDWEQQMFEQRRAMQGNWENGAVRSLENYRDAAANVAGQTERLFGGMFQGLEDAVVEFAVNGKASFGDFAKSVIADLIRIQARTAMSGLLQMGITAASAFFGGGGAATSFNGASSVAGSFGGATTTGIFYAGGGYTGDGGKYEPAGIVHRGEYVVDAETTAKPGVRVLLEALSGRAPGYADGGYVGGAASPAIFPAMSAGMASARSGGVVVNVYGAPSQPEVQETQREDGTLQVDLLFKQVDQRVDQRMARNMTRQGGYAYQMRNGMI